MITAEILSAVDRRLKQITNNCDSPFGGIDMIFCGDLRQLKAVMQTPIYNQPQGNMVSVWRNVQFFELTEVMRQENLEFSTLLTKIGNGLALTEREASLIESRFMTEADADRCFPNAVRLFYKNTQVTAYNNKRANMATNKIDSISEDTITGFTTHEQETHARQKLHQLKVGETGGLPYHIACVEGDPYIITTNIDVPDGLANGTVGHLSGIEYEESTNRIFRMWIKFPNKIGTKARRNFQQTLSRLPGIDKRATPIARRNATIYINRNSSLSAKRNHFPLQSANALTVHKAQGGTYDQIVYHYNRFHEQKLVYVALSRATSLEGIIIVPSRGARPIFYHKKENLNDKNRDVKQELERLSSNPLLTIDRFLSGLL